MHDPPPVTLAELPAWFVRVFAFLWGAVWGSFANVVIYRWPRELSLSHPPSRCPHCETPIRPYDNVPILGWMWLRGKCRACKAPISPRYPFVEALYAVAALVIAERMLRGETAPVLSVAVALFLTRFAFGWGLLTVAFIDMETFLIPDFISLGGTVLGVVAAAAIPGGDWQTSVKGVLLGGVPLLAINLFWSRVLKRTAKGQEDAVGMGDAKLMAMIGAFLGPAGVAFTFVAGGLQGIIATLVSRATGWQLGPDPSLLEEGDEDEASTAEAAAEPKGEAPKEEGAKDKGETPLGLTTIPFGPFLSVAAIEYLLGADALIPWWNSLIARLMEPFVSGGM
jgi:leader peptidase (prepilin peptidase)/N-methyltransferase